MPKAPRKLQQTPKDQAKPNSVGRTDSMGTGTAHSSQKKQEDILNLGTQTVTNSTGLEDLPITRALDHLGQKTIKKRDNKGTKN